jgi:hypothetical protein
MIRFIFVREKDFPTSPFKNTISFVVEALCLRGIIEVEITYGCCCGRGKGISSEVERYVTRCVLFLLVKGGFSII